jgi:hypothetical protein
MGLFLYQGHSILEKLKPALVLIGFEIEFWLYQSCTSLAGILIKKLVQDCCYLKSQKRRYLYIVGIALGHTNLVGSLLLVLIPMLISGTYLYAKLTSKYIG